MVEVVAERGYPETRVLDVIKRAGVSRKTFYGLFEDKEVCFLAVYDMALGRRYRATEIAFDSPPGGILGRSDSSRAWRLPADHGRAARGHRARPVCSKRRFQSAQGPGRSCPTMLTSASSITPCELCGTIVQGRQIATELAAQPRQLLADSCGRMLP